MADVVIAGGGPAGLATAVVARLNDLDVVVLDAAKRWPVDKACGEGLMPDGVDVLESIGVNLDGLDSHSFCGVRYIDGHRSADGLFPDKPGLGLRRSALHRAMIDRAESLGVDLRWGVRVQGLGGDGFETDCGRVTGRWLVGADGRASRVRGWARLGGGPPRRRRFGVRRHYEIAPWTNLVEVYWGDGCEAYVTPVGENLVGVACLWSGATASFDQLLENFPDLSERLAGAPVASKDRGAGPFEHRVQSVVSDNLALVGDASGSLDPISGEGLALSFRQAQALGKAIQAGDLRSYEAEHRRIRRFPAAITRLLMLVERHPRLRGRVMQSLSADPHLMSRFLALKLRAEGPRVFGAGGLVPLSAAALATKSHK